MRILLPILLFLSAYDLAEARNRVVMVTAFEPYRGREENGSQKAAEALLQMRPGDSIEYKLCLLPVEYERATEKALDCYQKMDPKPNLVISTGESGCSVRLEVRAHNVEGDPGVSDSSGVQRSSRAIDPDAPAHELLTLPVDAIYCGGYVSEIGPPQEPSVSPGYFVCNATAYRLARFFKNRRIPYGFVHVPEASCGYNYRDTARRLHDIAKVSIRVLSIPDTSFSIDGGSLSPERGVPVPTGPIPRVTSACREQVRGQIRSLLDRERRALELTRSRPGSTPASGSKIQNSGNRPD